MSVTVKSLNGDTSFLLVFSPPIAPLSSPGLFPGSFAILIDPWLVGPSVILNPIFSISEQRSAPCITHLKDIDVEPDLILISQHKPDHCHEETLRQLPSNCSATILATPAAAKKISSWKHFDPGIVQALPRYVHDDGNSNFRISLPPPSPRGSSGEVTVTWMPAKRDLTGLHHAIGITYRPPFTVLSNPSFAHYVQLATPPASPRSPSSAGSSVLPSPRLLGPVSQREREKTLSVIYSPHGVSYETVHSYATSHLVSESALPLTALLHSFDCVENPWWLGGTISTGSPGGLEIARNLGARAWISAHDADKDNRGWAVKQTRIGQYAVDEVRRMLQESANLPGKRSIQIDIVSLASGGERRIGCG